MGGALCDLIHGWLFKYQLDWLTDSSRNRVALKARQIGFSDATGLDAVLMASGIKELLFPDKIATHNVLIISKGDKEAKELVEKCKRWLGILKLVPAFAPYMETNAENKGEIKFNRSRRTIFSLAQSPEAGRSFTGHLVFDELAFWTWQAKIWVGAEPAIGSNMRLTHTCLSTPAPIQEQFYALCNDRQRNAHWSLHKVDIYKAVEQGFPVDIEDRKRSKPTLEDFEQEYCCKFVGGSEYAFSLTLLNASTRPRPREKPVARFLGIDSASMVDNTSVVVIDQYKDLIVIGDSYTIAKAPYETRLHPNGGATLGQDVIVNALIRYFKPRATRIDKTGDKGRRYHRGIKGLFYLLATKFPNADGGSIIPIDTSARYNTGAIKQLRDDMGSGLVSMAEQRKDYYYKPSRGLGYGDFARHVGIIPDDELGGFVRGVFQETQLDLLRRDFQKIVSSWSEQHNSVRFKAKRDAEGHADTFFAALYGVTTAQEIKAAPKRRETKQEALDQSAPAFFDFMG